jgi:hypothetical protein
LETLAHGPQTVKEVINDAEQLGISKRTVQRAASKLCDAAREPGVARGPYFYTLKPHVAVSRTAWQPGGPGELASDEPAFLHQPAQVAQDAAGLEDGELERLEDRAREWGILTEWGDG